MVTVKMPDAIHIVFSKTGARMQVDTDGCIEVEDLSQEYLDLIQHGGRVVSTLPEAAIFPPGSEEAPNA